MMVQLTQEQINILEAAGAMPQEEKKKRKPKKLPKVLKHGDAEKLFSKLNIKCPTGLRDRAAMQCMYSAGLRISEVTNLMVDDVDLAEGYLFLQQAKGNKDRTVPIDQETIDWLSRWAAIRPESDYFFCTLKGGRMSTRQLREKVYRMSKKSGVYIRNGKEKKLVNPHSFRHSCFTECLEDGLSIREIQELAGHKSIQTTSVYLSVRPEKLREKIRNRKKAKASV